MRHKKRQNGERKPLDDAATAGLLTETRLLLAANSCAHTVGMCQDDPCSMSPAAMAPMLLEFQVTLLRQQQEYIHRPLLCLVHGEEVVGIPEVRPGLPEDGILIECTTHHHPW